MSFSCLFRRISTSVYPSLCDPSCLCNSRLQQSATRGTAVSLVSATLETQLQIESARARTAEQERSALIPTLVTIRQERAGGMVETEGISQLFTLKGGAEQDFGEWTHTKCVRSCLQVLVIRFLVLELGHHVNGKSLSKVADFRRETASYPGSMSLEKVPTRRTSSTRSTIWLESSTHTLSLLLLQPTHQTESFGTLEKEMAWMLGDDCTVSTTPRRP